MIHQDARVTELWTSHHRFLLNVAYRLLGSYSEAEDTVQEAFTRLLRTDLDPIEDARAWLVVVVSRLCLDQLRSARVRREAYVGPWFPEPLIHSDEMSDPADIVTLDESVRMALLIVLERMSPAERVVFVLHDVFDFPFEKIAPLVKRSPAACRQLASRARRNIDDEAASARFKIDPAEQRRGGVGGSWRRWGGGWSRGGSGEARLPQVRRKRLFFGVCEAGLLVDADQISRRVAEGCDNLASMRVDPISDFPTRGADRLDRPG